MNNAHVNEGCVIVIQELQQWIAKKALERLVLSQR